MGRRSISTTKSGKFMNPTDQASKMAENILPSPLSFCHLEFSSFHWTNGFCYFLKGKKQEKES